MPGRGHHGAQRGQARVLGRLPGRGGEALLDRAVEGTLRFRVLRGRPSHEKPLPVVGGRWWGAGGGGPVAEEP